MSDKNQRVNFNLANPIQFLALGFGSGLAPKAPGTFGTLAAVPLFLIMSGLTPLIYALLVLVVCISGIYICGKAARDVGVHDHGAIVWDEFAGFFTFQVNHIAKEFCLLQSAMVLDKKDKKIYSEMVEKIIEQNTFGYPMIMD